MNLQRIRWVSLALIALALAATFLVVQFRQATSVARTPGGSSTSASPDVLGRAPDFELINRDGRTVRTADLLGAPWVADFVFTRCALSCPRLTSLMLRLGSEVPDLRRVSFTVDPEHDTAEVLADYAAGYGISDPEWLFLTGTDEAMRSTIVDGFKLPVVADPGVRLENPEEPILHSNRFVLVDRRGDVRGYYEATERHEYRRLLRDLAALKGEAAMQKTGAIARDRELTPEACRREIEELHQFFEAWFRGDLPETDEAFARFAEVIAEDFSIIGPGGAESDRSGIVETLRGSFGSRRDTDFAIWIENIRVRECGVDRCIANYEEWQRSDGTARGRLSTAIFARREAAPNGLEWRLVHETWLSTD